MNQYFENIICIHSSIKDCVLYEGISSHHLCQIITGLTYPTNKLTDWVANGLSTVRSIDLLRLTGLTLSSRGMPLLCTAWNCSWLNSVAILSRIWPANNGLYKQRQTFRQVHRLNIKASIDQIWISAVLKCCFCSAVCQQFGYFLKNWRQEKEI